MKEKGFETVKIKVIGQVGLMFDRFVDMSADDRPPEQKMYLAADNQLMFPAENIYSFYFSEKPAGCAARFEGKQWKQYKTLGMSFATIAPESIPILRNGKKLFFTKFVNEYDKEAKIKVMHHKANIMKGKLIIPSPKIRPVLEPPWEINFEVTLWQNRLIDITKIKNWTVSGGIEIGLGTYRPRFGRFVAEFEE